MSKIAQFVLYLLSIFILDFVVHSWGYIFNADRSRPDDELRQLRRSVRYNPAKAAKIMLALPAAAALTFVSGNANPADYGMLIAIPLVAVLLATTVLHFLNTWRRTARAIDRSHANK